VTISYLTHGVVKHLALAIHGFASDAQSPGGELMASDDDGRPVVVTSYYCVPYVPVAEHGFSYQALYKAFTAIPLSPENGSVLPAKLPLPSSPPAAPGKGPGIDPLAARTAALLVSGRPVCVLGAQETGMAERLAFVDAVMALLPYGFRARMSAATWTRATNRNHRFRLFFSGARRDAKEPDHVVYWGRPLHHSPPAQPAKADRDRLSGDHGYAGRMTPEKLADLAHLRRARDLMDREYARPLDVAGLARAALMSTAHFSRQFRAAYGETPYAYLMTRRIERAKALLRRGDLSVTDVCLAVGCTSLGSFSARFTQMVGETPTAYRAGDHSALVSVPGCIAKELTRPSRAPSRM
jgi:AraC-like DNA-binding protein